MKLVQGILISLVALVLGTLGFAYSGIYDVSADSPHSGLVTWFLSTTSHASVERRAGNIVVPDLSSEQLVMAGAGDYDGMCADCHGAPGRESGPVGLGLNPAPPDLANHAADLSAAELFWITKHGIKMTGMPAWGETHDDAALWPVVAFLTRLPKLDAAAYQDLQARGQGASHHSSSGGEQHQHEADSPNAGSPHAHGTSEADSSEDVPPDHEDHDHDH